MKGHLSAEQLKEYSYKNLQALAKDMGVNASGKAEEIIARITAVEVDVGELMEEEKALFNAEAAAGQLEDKEAAGGQTVEVEVITRYLDQQFNKIKEAGEVFTVDSDRAAVLLAEKVVKIKE